MPEGGQGSPERLYTLVPPPISMVDSSPGANEVVMGPKLLPI